MASIEQRTVSEFVFIRQFEETNEPMLVNSPQFMSCVVAAYLLFVLKLGPAFMKNREPYKLKNAVLVYNAIQVVLSLALVYKGWYMIKLGLVPERCYEEDPVLRKHMIKAAQFGIYCRIAELIDTIFFVLRKKYNQVSFLHVIHHSQGVIGTCLLMKYSISPSVIVGGTINGLVHVIMYSYYFLAALGPQYQKYLTWKKYITTLQLIQFVMIFLHQVISITYTTCKHSLFGMFYILIATAMFYILFKQFYDKSYVDPKKTIQNGTHNGTCNDTHTVTHNGTNKSTYKVTEEKVKAQ